MTAGSGAAALREDGEGWYLYGVIAAGAAPVELEGVTAVDPRHGIDVLTERDLAGVTSRVSLAEFDEAALPERLGDAAWLEQKIRAHEDVLESVLASAPVIPCRFCTVYRSEGDLRLFLAERSGVLGEALARVAGKVELGVKAFVDHERFTAGAASRSESIRKLQESAAQAESGRAYLERRRLEKLAGDDLAQFKGTLGAELHARLLAAADDGVELALQKPELSGREEEMVFNGAYLVSDHDRFRAEVDELAAGHAGSGLELEVTGPWPPYNFVPAELGGS